MNSAPVTSVTDHAVAQGTYLRHLTGIRALAAVAVLLHHVWLTTFQTSDGRIVGSPWFLSWLQAGSYGVTVFIVVSGYSLTLSMARHGRASPSDGNRAFFVRRARRILPAYWTVLAISALLGMTLLSNPSEFVYQLGLPVTGTDVAVHALLMHDVIGNPAGINYVLWSMAVEWHIYLLMPLMLLAIRVSGVWPMVIGFTLASALVARFAVNHSDVRLLAEFQLVGGFAIGVGACWLARARPRAASWRWLGGALALGAGTVDYLNSLHWQDRLLGGPVVSVLLAAAVGCFLSAGTDGSVLARILGWAPFVWIGERSYSFYLVHPLVLALLWNYGLEPSTAHDSSAFAPLAMGGFLLTLAFAHVLYRQVELRFLVPRGTAGARS